MLDISFSMVDNFVNLLFAIINNDAVAMLNSYFSLTVTACVATSLYVFMVLIKNHKFLAINTKLIMATLFYALGDWLSE